MPVLDTGIHAAPPKAMFKPDGTTWIAGSSPAMTARQEKHPCLTDGKSCPLIGDFHQHRHMVGRLGPGAGVAQDLGLAQTVA